MKKLTRSQRKLQRKKIKTSTTAENKLLSAVKRLFKISLPEKASMEDVKSSFAKINKSAIDPYINRYTKDLLKNNRDGFQQILNAMVVGKSGNTDLQNSLDKAFHSLVQEERIYKPLLSKFKENVKLIKNIPQHVQAKLQEGYEEGVSFRGTEVEKYLQETLGKRAKIIIRTESSKVNAALTEIRAKELDINGYVWSTSEDQRVRASHKLMDGVLVFWDTVPT